MKYVIYSLIETDERIVPDGYNIKTVYTTVMEELNVGWIKSEHDSIEQAVAEIEANKHELRGLRLTICPILEISWEGEIK